MGLHPFNREKALRKLRFRQHRGQYIKIGTIILSVIIFVAGIIYYSYSKYTVTNKFDVIQTTVGEFSKCKLYTKNQEFTFDYIGAEQTFTPTCDGYYKLETWGAQGGSTYGTGGYGSYSTGIINANKDTSIYVYVGNQPTTISKSFNGGGVGEYAPTYNVYKSSGGGATDIRRDGNDIANRIIVSGGGGGGTAYYSISLKGGSAGGAIGGIIQYYSTELSGATNSKNAGAGQTYSGLANQDTGWSHVINVGQGSLGQGGDCGGSGYYGGAWYNTYDRLYSGCGGSGYIGNSLLISSTSLTKHMACYNCGSSTDVETYTISNTCVSSTPTTDCAKQGNGYAKITYLGSTLD